MSTSYTQYPSLYTQWAIALHNAFPAISFQAFFTWITAEGSPGYQNNNPLNIPYYNFLAQGYGATNLGPGLANTAAFPTPQAGLQATIDAITGKLPFNDAINNIGAVAQHVPGNDIAILQYVQQTGWAKSGYYGGLPGLYSSIDFSGAPTGQSGGGIGSVPVIGGIANGLGGIGNAITGGIDSFGNAISNNGTISIPGLPNPSDVFTGLESWLQNMFKNYIAKWVIIALIAIAMFILFDKLVSGNASMAP